MVKAAILCEGKNDQVFFETLMNHLGFDKHKVSFYIFSGKSKFFQLDNTNYKDLKLEIDSGQIGKALFVVDADDIKKDSIYGGFENTLEKLNDVIKKLEIEGISDTYVMCDPTTKIGYLESFLLSTIPEAQRDCINNFLACSKFESKENHKAIINQIYNIAYPKAPYNFGHHHFELLKTQLTHLFKYPINA